MTASRAPRATPLLADAVALGPSLLAGLYAVWAGTFSSGASGAATVVAHGVLLAWALAGFSGRPSRLADPLALGSSGRVLLWALVAAVVLAWWLSPVRRAGLVGVVLLPALLIVPSVVARCWSPVASASGARLRVVGARGMALVVAGVSLWGLGSWLVGASELPAEPLGHHLLLASWVVTLLPLAALPLAERGAGRWTGTVVGGVALASGVGAVLATRSLAGLLALAVEAGIAGLLLARGGGRRPGDPGRQRLLRLGERLAAIALVASIGTVLFAAWSGEASLRARAAYWRGGWEGVLERPVTGFGPGGSAWTLAAFVRPVPGVNPPGEVVGEVHLLPLAVAYEIGLPGLLLVLGVVVLFALRRGRDLHGPGEAVGEEGRSGGCGLAVAGLVGLAGVATMGCATADWRILALPVAAAVAAGAALAGTPAPGGEHRRQGRGGRRVAAVVTIGYALTAGAILLPLDRAHLLYDRAIEAGANAGDRSETLERLDAAVRLDPGHPLYRFHAGREVWLLERDGRGRSRAPRRTMREALATAADAHGVAAFWLRAGAAAAAAGEPAVAAAAFETGCGLDPLGAAAPFGLLAVGSSLHRPEALGARALAAEPRLGAALLWEERPELLERMLHALESAAGIDAGWREEAIRRVSALHAAGGQDGAVATIAVVADATPSASLALHTFRRLPWRLELVPVPVRRRGAESLADLPPATVLDGTDPRLFPPTCTGPFAPQLLRKTLWKTW